jgi:tetratricopeptide (TPR) repeat protein
MRSTFRKKQIPLIYLLLTVAAIMAFRQVSLCDFINYDDPLYVTDNIHVKSGITLGSIRWAFTTGYSANWHPVTWMSHMLDVQLFGLKPRWHHLTNLLFHIANTLLLFFVFHRMTKAPWKSAFVAALFALHPLHVESVAWVSERKDVLSTFFWMLTMGAYIHYVEHRTEDGRQSTEDGEKWTGILRFPSSVFRYSAVLIFFVLGLMAKPMLVTLPFVLLLLDYWPLQRFEPKKSAQQFRTELNKSLAANKRKGKSSRKHTTSRSVELEEKPADRKYQWALIRPLLREKIPLFALAALSSIVTFIAQQKGGAVKSIEAFPPGVRIANAFVSYIVYIGKTIWPINLAVYYPHRGLWPLWQALGAVLLLIAVTISVIRTAKRFPYLTMGWLWFTGTLVPVIGIVQVGNQAMADRYTYIPLIGLFVMAAWGIPELLKKWQPTYPPRKEALFASSALVLVSLFIVTWTQVGYWRNSIALFDYTLKVTSPNDLIQRTRGSVYYKLGNYTQAISDFDRAIEINPKYAEAYYNRGLTYGKLGNLSQAISDYDRAIKIDPEYAEAYNNRGIAYGELGNLSQAISDYDRAIEINPKYAEAYNNRGAVYGTLSNNRQAISDYDRAIEIDPEFALAYINRGAAYRELGNQTQAISDFDRAIEINPEYAKAYYNRGVVYDILGNNRQAIPNFDRAIEINPEYADAYNNRGVAYGKLGNPRQAISDFDRAIEINPEYAKAYYNRGVVYGILRNQRQATEDLQKAARLDSEDAKNSLKSRGISW